MNARFSFFGLGFSSRFAISAFFYTAAAALYFTVPAGYPFRFFVPVLCAVPLLFLKAKNFSNRPADLGKEEWKPVTMKEIDRLADRVRRVKKTRTGSGAVILTALFLFALLFFGLLSGFSACFFLAGLYLIFVPWLWFARVESWYPKRLSAKLEIFLTVLNYPFGPAYRVIPMLRFDEDKQGRRIPEDIQVMVEPGEGRTSPGAGTKPGGLVGVQFQLVFNNGPNGEVPYMYAVFITRGCNSLWKALVRKTFYGFVTEVDTDSISEFGTVILRLDTESRSDGYKTDEEDVEQLIKNVIKALEKTGG
ncbi:MAG: hypothetical protein LBP69_02735 [Treponema sp.]|jgi:hypothetical protein|nr:hypothetical protein [Treponema sp.]